MKRHFEHGNLVKLFETKGLKLLCNVMHRWISMLCPMKKMFVDYKTTLVVHMNNNLNHVVTTKTKFLEYFCDIEVVMGLMCIKPMLAVVHALIKFAHAHDMCDFVTVVK
jgi:hypothetical protein